MRTFDRFPVTSREQGGARRSVRTIRCACGYAGEINDSSASGLPIEAVARKFAQRGWKVGRAAGGDRCPNCAAGRDGSGGAARPLSPRQKRAAFCRIAGVARAGTVTKPKGEEPVSDASTQAARDLQEREGAAKAAADPPRQPTREDKRRVLDALEEHYLAERGCYAKSFSDATLAETLDCPRAWVAALREEFYGPDANEDALDRASRLGAALAGFEAEAKALMEKGLAMAAQAEDLLRRIERLKS